MKSKTLLLTAILTSAVSALLIPARALETIPPQPVTDINATGDSSPTHITYAQDHLYFVANDAAGHSALYGKNLVTGTLKKADPVLNRPPAKLKSLTNAAGTTFLTDNFVVAPNSITQKETLYFHVIGDGLYVTKGSKTTTLRMLKWVDSINGSYIDPQVTAFQSTSASKKAGVVFTGFKATTGFEPFVSYGSALSTRILANIAPGSANSFPYDYCARPAGTFQDQLYFGAYDATDMYQLHCYRQDFDTKKFLLEHYVTCRTDSQANNLATFPFGMTLAGNDIVFSTGNHQADNGRDLGFIDTGLGQFSILAGTGNIAPLEFETASVSSGAFFSGFNVNFTARVLWAAFGDGSDFAQIYDETTGTNPRNIKTFPPYNTFGTSPKFTTYYIADAGGGPHLFRKFSMNASIIIKTATNADLFVTDFNAVTDPEGNGEIFIIGHTQGSVDTLWVLDNTQQGTIDEQASQVLTAQGHPLIGPSNLCNATHLVGATAYSRLYFSCSGVGTEFEFKVDKNGAPTSTPRGEELWVYQLGE